jgi:hypothetical protein
MSSACPFQRHPPNDPPPDLQLFRAWTDRPIAAILVVDGDDGVLWYNSRLVRGLVLSLVEMWALRQAHVGWSFALLSEADIAKLADSSAT